MEADRWAAVAGVEVRRVGAHALLIEVTDPAAWYESLLARRTAGELDAVDLVPGARTVLIDGLADPGRTAARLPGWAPTGGSAAVGSALVTIPVRYDGADLPAVARLWGLTIRDAVRTLASTEYRVAFCGFAPGFGYLTGLPTQLAVPRLATPRDRVAAGSVGLAGEYAAIYPTASPGGWQLVGRTDTVLFDPAGDPPALLVPGARVRMPEC
jgi:KipI family sensor histidine kinase inhibitor